MPAADGATAVAAQATHARLAGGRNVVVPARVVHGARAAAAAVGNFYIRGGGYGHGIGMSQYGAYGYALRGYSYGYILSHYYTGTALRAVDAKQTVRVLLKTGSAAFNGATAAGSKSLSASLTYTIKALSDGSLVVTNPSGKTVGHFAAPLTVTGPGPLDVVGLGSYRGALEFRADGHGGVQTVDAVGLDNYVRGVISAEMPAGWSAQALEAQAVAARTYAITTTVGGNGYTLYPDTRSQMYRGVAAETPATDAAVAATSGQVVTYRGAPVATLFFASSGGHTESIQNVWPGAAADPWLQGVPDPYDGAAGADPYHKWGYNMTLAAAQARLGSLVKGSLIGIRVTRHGASPRILAAQVVGTRGTSTVSGTTLQNAFGLLTTFAAFTSITTYSGLPATASRQSAAHSTWLPAKLAVDALRAVVPTLSGVAKATGVHGAVFPAARGALIAIQKLSGRTWRRVKQARLGSGGSFAVRLAGPGRYRIVFGGLYGPAVTVH